MLFKPENFRVCDLKPWKLIRDNQRMTLILIKANGEACYERTRAGKDALVQRFDAESDLLLLAWTGQHKTDIFLVTPENLIP
jgi:hypothetical protein